MDLLINLTLYDIIVYIGVYVFALSGALLGMQKNHDVYGMFILALVTGAGGGVMRDIMIGHVPPRLFSDPLTVIISLLATVSVLMFDASILRRQRLLDTFDAIGLGLFGYIGIKIGYDAGLGGYPSTVLAVLTGTGGGMIRDVLANEVPFVLRKDVYATAVIVACCVSILLIHFGISIDDPINMVVNIVLTFAIRMITLMYNWHLIFHRK